MLKDIGEAQFIIIKNDGWDDKAKFIKDEKELNDWLQDGSLEEGDKVFKVQKLFIVQKKVAYSLKEVKIHEK